MVLQIAVIEIMAHHGDVQLTPVWLWWSQPQRTAFPHRIPRQRTRMTETTIDSEIRNGISSLESMDAASANYIPSDSKSYRCCYYFIDWCSSLKESKYSGVVLLEATDAKQWQPREYWHGTSLGSWCAEDSRIWDWTTLQGIRHYHERLHAVQVTGNKSGGYGPTN